MPFVVPGVARFTVHQTLEGRAVANVLDYRIDTTGSTMSRDTAVDNQAGSIIEQWASQILPAQSNQLSLDRVTYVDLDSINGVTGSRTTGGGFTLPDPGGNANAPLPNNTSVLVRKQISGARGRRSGRMYVAGYNEGMTLATDGNSLDSASVAALSEDFNLFRSNTQELDALGTAFSSLLVVVHITSRDADDNPLTGVSTPTTALVVDQVLATQRRRMRR